MLSIRRLTLCITRMVTRSVLPRQLSSVVPDKPTWQPIEQSSEEVEIDDEMIEHLERLSLVEFNNEAGVERLRSAIKYANQLGVVNTEGVEPMYSVLEEEELMLREDHITEGGCRSKVIQNAQIIDEDYFVAPPGNIPLSRKDKTLNDDETSNEVNVMSS